MPNCTTSTNPSPSECIFGGVSGSCSISGSWFLWQRDPLGECNIRFARKILSHCDHAVLGFNMKRERERESAPSTQCHGIFTYIFIHMSYLQTVFQHHKPHPGLSEFAVPSPRLFQVPTQFGLFRRGLAVPSIPGPPGPGASIDSPG